MHTLCKPQIASPADGGICSITNGTHSIQLDYKSSRTFGYIERNGDDRQFYQIEISDILGKKIQLIEGNGKKSSISLHDFSAGVYEIKLIVNNQSKGVKKLVVIK